MLGARVEYEFHIPFARDQGLSDALIAAIGAGETPPFADAVERIIYEANVQLLRSATLAAHTREEVIGLLGHRGMIQLIAAISLYVITAYTTNVARVRLAEDFSADPEKLNAFFAGRPVDGK
jgi:4-carboxymuconolactone decarboxylase